MQRRFDGKHNRCDHGRYAYKVWNVMLHQNEIHAFSFFNQLDCTPMKKLTASDKNTDGARKYLSKTIL